MQKQQQRWRGKKPFQIVCASRERNERVREMGTSEREKKNTWNLISACNRRQWNMCVGIGCWCTLLCIWPKRTRAHISRLDYTLHSVCSIVVCFFSQLCILIQLLCYLCWRPHAVITYATYDIPLTYYVALNKQHFTTRKGKQPNTAKHDKKTHNNNNNQKQEVTE